MYSAIIIYAHIRGGKTEACKKIAERYRKAGIPIGGIISPCKLEGDKIVGYDCIDLSSGDRFPIVKLGTPDYNWYHYGSLKYVFSESGFSKANDILNHCSKIYENIIFDEFGRIEKNKKGLYQGFYSIAQNLKNGFYLITCREDLVDIVKDYIPKEVNIFEFKASEYNKIWAFISEETM